MTIVRSIFQPTLPTVTRAREQLDGHLLLCFASQRLTGRVCLNRPRIGAPFVESLIPEDC